MACHRNGGEFAMFSVWMPTVTNPSISRADIAVSGPLRHLPDQKSQSGLPLGPFFVLTATWQAVDKKNETAKPEWTVHCGLMLTSTITFATVLRPVAYI